MKYVHTNNSIPYFPTQSMEEQPSNVKENIFIDVRIETWGELQIAPYIEGIPQAPNLVGT